MTNNKLTDERVLQRLSQFEGAYKEACAFQDDDFASECADIVRALREVLERRKADSAEPIYQNYPDDGWSDCSKEIYEKLTELGCRTRIVYAAPPVPEECPAELLAFCEQVIDSRITANAKADELWNACRTAMQQAAPVELQERRKADEVNKS